MIEPMAIIDWKIVRRFDQSCYLRSFLNLDGRRSMTVANGSFMARLNEVQPSVESVDARMYSSTKYSGSDIEY